MVYPSKSTPTDISRLTTWSVKRCASYCKNTLFYLYYICYIGYISDSPIHKYIYICMYIHIYTCKILDLYTYVQLYISINILGPSVPWASWQLVSPLPDLRRYCSGYLILDHHFLVILSFRTQILDTKIVHTSGKNWDVRGLQFRFGGSINVDFFLKVCSHIQKKGT